jgi:hypothetical protein
LGAQNNGGGAVTANATTAQAWQRFTLVDVNGGALESGDSVLIQAGNGQYFQALNGGGSTLNAGSNNRQGWETFKLVKQSGSGPIVNGDIVGLRCAAGAWVSAQDGGGGPVFAYGGALGSWEQLKLSGLPAVSVAPPPTPTPTPNGSDPSTISGVSFRTSLGGKYLGAQNDGGGGVVATAGVAQAWETFSLIDINGGALQSGDGVFIQAGNGQYFQALNGGGSTLNAGSDNRRGWETFTLVKQSGSGAVVSGDIVGLQTSSGSWISAENGGGGAAYAYGGALGSWEQMSLVIAGGGSSKTPGGGNPPGSGATRDRGDIVGKISVGYQGWFNAVGDGSRINPPWWHWTPDRTTPTPANNGIKSWPDVSELGRTYATGFPNLGNGRTASLYSDWDASTVDTQIKWMQDAGIDTIALQRFGDFRGSGEARNVVAAHVRDAAEAHGRKFYVMYDISNWSSFQADLKSDFTQHIQSELQLTDSPAYAKQDGKPVVAIWGLGYTGHPGAPETTLDVIRFFQGLGVYVIGGLGNDWRTADGARWSQAGFLDVFDALDAISPWMVGVIRNDADSDGNRRQYNEGDVAYLHARGKHYQPGVLPGDLQARQRRHGDFMWHQFYNMIQSGADGLYISMFDEYNEGNQIAKTAASAADVPVGSGILALDEDGTKCSPDYYLRLTGDGGKMLKKQIALTATRPTSPL